MILTEITGDLLVEAEKGNVDVIVHQANLEHTFGAGIARAIRLKFPYAFEADKRTPFNDPNKLGTFSIGNAPNSPLVVNMYSQTSLYPSHTSYDAMVEALTTLRDRLEPLNVFNRIGFPYQLGSGLADGDWNVVKAIILSVFEKSRFEVVIVRLPDAQKSDSLTDTFVDVAIDALKTL
jgi:Predicted phosphatase homologous to the C-terminal domain of histone macroH2A1